MKDLLKFPLNIQLFADDGDEAGSGADDKSGNEGTGAEDKNQGSKAKTFTQEEVNALIGKEKAKFQKKLKELSTTDDGEKSKEAETKTGTQEANPYLAKYAQAEIKVAMTMNGIDPQKVARAVKLIDTSEVLTDSGDIDSTKLNESIANLLKEWPELKTSASSTSTNRIGSNRDDKGNQEKDPKQKYRDAIEAKIANDKAKK